MKTGDDVTFLHDKADAAKSGQCVISILSDHIYVLVLLAYCVNLACMQCMAQMGRWNGSVLQTNVTCADLSLKCLLLPIYAYTKPL